MLVLFDCSSTYNSRLLNSEWMSGPYLINLLSGVLFTCRQEQVAFMGDIEPMFYQVRLAEKYCSFLRICGGIF